jgi:hypothetical protein
MVRVKAFIWKEASRSGPEFVAEWRFSAVLTIVCFKE